MGLPKGDRADVRCFKSAVAKRLQAARGGVLCFKSAVAKRLQAARGGVLKLSPLLFTINELGPALTSLVNETPTDFSILKPRTDWADPPLIFIRRCA